MEIKFLIKQMMANIKKLIISKTIKIIIVQIKKVLITLKKWINYIIIQTGMGCCITAKVKAILQIRATPPRVQ